MISFSKSRLGRAVIAWVAVVTFGFTVATLSSARDLRSTSFWGMEQFGNDPPLIAGNFPQFPSIINTLNQPSRVYWWWVNGNEMAFYRGGANQLNFALRDYSLFEGKLTRDRSRPTEVAWLPLQTPLHPRLLLIPGTPIAKSFKQIEVPYDWDIHILGGIAASMYGTTFPPLMRAYIGEGGIDLADVKIPEQIEVLQVSDLKAELIGKINQTLGPNPTTNPWPLLGISWSTRELGDLDPYDEEIVSFFADLLDHDELDVRHSALHGLRKMDGSVLQSLLPKILALHASGRITNENAIKALTENVATLIADGPPDAERKKFEETKARIARFVENRRNPPSNSMQ